MARFRQGVVAAAALAGTFAISEQAQAGPPVPKGTMKLAAERMVGFSLNIPGGPADPYFSTSILASANPGILQFPRVGFDYFVIDGLSIGGNAGMSYLGWNDALFWMFLPRVGYAFALTPKLDFWPRGGIGIAGSDQWNGFWVGSNTTGIFVGEAMFVWNIHPNAGLEFGPTFDIEFDGGSAALAGAVGLVATF